MRFLHIGAPHLGFSEDLNLNEKLVLDTGGGIPLQGDSFTCTSHLHFLFIELPL